MLYGNYALIAASRGGAGNARPCRQKRRAGCSHNNDDAPWRGQPRTASAPPQSMVALRGWWWPYVNELQETPATQANLMTLHEENRAPRQWLLDCATHAHVYGGVRTFFDRSGGVGGGMMWMLGLFRRP